MVASTATNQISTSYLGIYRYMYHKTHQQHKHDTVKHIPVNRYHKTHQQQKHETVKHIPVNQILNDSKNECVALRA